MRAIVMGWLDRPSAVSMTPGWLDTWTPFVSEEEFGSLPRPGDVDLYNTRGVWNGWGARTGAVKFQLQFSGFRASDFTRGYPVRDECWVWAHFPGVKAALFACEGQRRLLEDLIRQRLHLLEQRACSLLRFIQVRSARGCLARSCSV